MPRSIIAAALLALWPVAAQAQKPMVVIPPAAAEFKPIDPARPQGAAIAVLRGDPATGPSSMLLRMPRGTGVMHIHTADYELVVISGDMKHWAPGQTLEAAPVVGPGGYWLQPGGQAHADACLSDSCLMLVVWSGARDARRADVAG